MNQSDTTAVVSRLNGDFASLKEEWERCSLAAEDTLDKVRKARVELERTQNDYLAVRRLQEQAEEIYMEALLKEINADDDEVVRKIMKGKLELDQAKLWGAYLEYENILIERLERSIRTDNTEELEIVLQQIERIVGVKKARDIRLLPLEILEAVREKLLKAESIITPRDHRVAFDRARYLQGLKIVSPERIVDVAFAAIRMPLGVAGKIRYEVY